MADTPQVTMARMMWAQARQAMQLQHQAWLQVMSTQQAFLKSLAVYGLPPAVAQQFEGLMQAEEQRFSNTLSQVDAIEQSHLELLGKTGFPGV